MYRKLMVLIFFVLLCLAGTSFAGDTDPPGPDPMTWNTEPYAISDSSIRMIAATATDASGVEYYFDETTGNIGGSDSGWRDSPIYEDIGLDVNTTYSYRVIARDKSENHNMTGWSTTESATPFDPDLVACWKLDESSGTVASDSSGNNHTGTLQNGATFTSGLINNAVRFYGNDYGSDDRISCGTFNVTGDAITIAAWFKADTFTGDWYDGRIVAKTTGTADADHTWMLSTIRESSASHKKLLRFRLKTNNSTITLIASSGYLSTDTWYHAAAVYDGSTMKLYLDANEVGSVEKSGPITSTTTSVAIGHNPPDAGNTPWDGLIDDVRIYQRALSQADLQNLARRLVAYAPNPADQATHIGIHTDLSWSPGAETAEQNVYFGSNFDDVNNATYEEPCGVYITALGAESNSIARSVFHPAGELEMDKTYYWRIDGVNDLTSPFVWKGDVWSFTVIGGKAENPSPPDEANDIPGTSDEPTLSWTNGLKADTSDVYFGTSFEDVNDANHSDPEWITNTADANITRAQYHPAQFDLGKTYYWRIDEVNTLMPPYVWKGDVWSFSIANYLTIDDFESYASDAALQAVWVKDAVPKVTPVLCTTLPVLNAQSMFMSCYNNLSPYYANVTKTFAAEQDWSATSAAGVKAIGLSYFGMDTNLGDHLYIKLVDGTGKVAKMTMTDSASLKKEAWQQLNFALADFTSPEVINLARIKQLIIGVGHGVKTGMQRIYIDNVRIYVSRCVPEYGPAGDVTGDCFTDMRDLKKLSLHWGTTTWSVEVEDPCSPPVLNYPFDGSAADVSGNHYDGHVVDNAPPAYGFDRFNVFGKALLFDGFSTYVEVPVALFAGISEQITVSLWHYGDVETWDGKPVVDTHRHLFFAENPADHPEDLNDTWTWRNLNLYFMPANNNVYATIGNDAQGHLDWIMKTPNLEDVEGKWNHWAITKDCNAGELKVYLNGALWNWNTDPATIPIENIAVLRLGAETATNWDPIGDKHVPRGLLTGRIDDFRIYDYALSQAEICSLAGMTVGYTYIQPLQLLLYPDTNTNIYEDDRIDFKDFTAMATTWLQEQLWP